jgi:hypothetical protein
MSITSSQGDDLEIAGVDVIAGHGRQLEALLLASALVAEFQVVHHARYCGSKNTSGVQPSSGSERRSSSASPLCAMLNWYPLTMQPHSDRMTSTSRSISSRRR